MFSQQEEQRRGMERDCYCCRPGPSLPPPPTPSTLMDPSYHTMSSLPLSLLYSEPPLLPPPSAHHGRMGRDARDSNMDVEGALSELDSLNSATVSQGSAGGSVGVRDHRPERKARARSLSESMAGTCCQPSKSRSETSLYRPGLETPGGSREEAKGGHYLPKTAGGSMSLPRKLGHYHMIQRNSAFVSDILSPSSLHLHHHHHHHHHHPSPLQLPGSSSWGLPSDSGVGSYSEHSSSKSSSSPPPPCNLGSYREPDPLEERQRAEGPRQRRISRFRKDRYRRLRQPYAVPFRMCQSMSEDSTASLNDFLSDSGRTCKSTTASPVKPQVDLTRPRTHTHTHTASVPGVGPLVRSRSIDNLELAKLRLTDGQTDAASPPAAGQDMEQMATDLKNLHMV